MELDNGIEIDDIIKEGGWEDITYDPPVVQLPATDNDSAVVDAERAEAATGGRGQWTKKKLTIGLVVSVTFLALVIGLSAGLGTNGRRTASSAKSSAITLQDCLNKEREEEIFKSASTEEKTAAVDIPTFTPTTFGPTSDAPTTSSVVTTTAPEVEWDAFFPIFDDGGTKPDDSLFSDRAPGTSNDGRDQGRELRGGRSTEGVSSLARKKMAQRLLGATVKRKLLCEDLLKDYRGGSTSKRSSKSCSSSNSGKSGSSNSTSKSGKSSKGSKRDCKDDPTSKPSSLPSEIPSSLPSEIPSSSPTPPPMILVRSQNFSDRCWTVNSDTARVELVLDNEACTAWVVRPGLTGAGVSFEDANNPGFFLRHATFIINVQQDDGNDTDQFNGDATFTREDALTGTPGYESYRSVSSPNRYIRHSSFVLRLDASNNSDLFNNDASFLVTPVEV